LPVRPPARPSACPSVRLPARPPVRPPVRPRAAPGARRARPTLVGMSVIRLLVLGAVRQHGRAHGYQVRNDLEYWGAHEWSDAKPGSIHHALKQMAKQGLLVAHETAPTRPRPCGTCSARPAPSPGTRGPRSCGPWR
ncbi:Transcriptional regulator PadR-like family protein, partial [Streptomyces sp. di50b]